MIFSLHKLITRYNPDICVIEAPLLVNSPKTLILLAEIVGAVRGATVGQAKYIEFSPSTWRKLIANPDEKFPIKRVLCKPWDIQKVKELCGVETENDNIADAILIGLARIKQFSLKQK